MAFDPTYSFEYLKSHIGVVRVLETYGLREHLRQRGPELVGPCPLHCGDNPTAFQVRPDRNLWHCWTACGGGDVVELVRRIHDCDFPQAARHLRSLLRDQPVPHHDCPSRVTSGLTSFHPFESRIDLDPEVPFLQQGKGVTVYTARAFEAGSPTRSSFLRGTVAVRLHDLAGRPLGYCGRRLDQKEIELWGKWRFPKNFPKSDCLFAAHRAHPFRRKGLVVVECPWAAMRLSQAGIHGSVALLGTHISEVQEAWLANAQNILLLLDGDAAGREATLRLKATLSSHTRVHSFQLPDGLEPEDLADAELRSLVSQAFSFFE